MNSENKELHLNMTKLEAKGGTTCDLKNKDVYELQVINLKRNSCVIENLDQGENRTRLTPNITRNKINHECSDLYRSTVYVNTYLILG